MRVGIIGAGLQGRRRAPVVRDSPNNELVVISAAHEESARNLAKKMGCEHAVGWETVVSRNDLDCVMICTPPHIHAKIAIAAMKSGKQVLCEKPLARNSQEAKEMVTEAKKNNVVLKCGFNHRYHPAIRKARDLLDTGRLGHPYFIRGTYGICGRPGYEKEWRADPNIAAGGQLMEQGIHLIDLSRWFLGEFSMVFAVTNNFYWRTEPLEDNAFVLLRSEEGRTASLHSSLTQWKNTFCLELYGSDGYVSVDGLGGGYGVERLTYGFKDFSKPFVSEVTEFRGDDPCWTEEWKDFEANIVNRGADASGLDGLVALRLVEAAYESVRALKPISVSAVD